MTILKAFKYRIYPTKQQEVLLNKTFGCVRVVWNYNVEIFNKYDKNLSKQEKALTSTELRKKLADLHLKKEIITKVLDYRI